MPSLIAKTGIGIGIAALVLMAVGVLPVKAGHVKLRYDEWYCSDVRIDSLRLPLEPVCHEYKRLDSKKKETDAKVGER